MYKRSLERKHKLQATSELNNGNTWIKKRTKPIYNLFTLKKSIWSKIKSTKLTFF